MSSAGCGGCDRRWTSTAQAHCQSCHEQFATHGTADKHHSYGPNREQSCNDPALMVNKAGLVIFRASTEAEGKVWRSAARRAFDHIATPEATA